MSWASRPLVAFTLSLVFGLSWFDPSVARAEDESRVEGDASRDRARRLALEGIELFEKERWQDAHERLSEAFELYPAPTVALLDAKALENMGRLIEAAALFERAAALPVDDDSPKPFRRAVQDAQNEHNRVSALIPTLSIDVSQVPGTHTLEFDGRALPEAEWSEPHPVDPGTYTVIAKGSGSSKIQKQVTLTPGAKVTLVLAASETGSPLPPVAAAKPAEPRSSALTWTALGVGAAGLVTGVVAGAVMLDAKASLDRECNSTCPPDSRDTLDRFRTSRAISIAGYSAGAVGVGLGLWLLFDDAPSNSAVSGRAYLSRDHAELQLSGAF